VGEKVGLPDGAFVGETVGNGVGLLIELIRSTAYVGLRVGSPEGAAVGAAEGNGVGDPLV
jgi:hypothetical protein